jgi:hypothetical protein
LVDATTRSFLAADPPVDFACNRLPWDRTYPIGTDTEVCSREALETAWREAANHREASCPSSTKIRIGSDPHVVLPTRSRPEVDYRYGPDLAVREIYARLPNRLPLG